MILGTEEKIMDAFWDALSCGSESEPQISNTFRCGVKKHRFANLSQMCYNFTK